MILCFEAELHESDRTFCGYNVMIYGIDLFLVFRGLSASSSTQIKTLIIKRHKLSSESFHDIWWLLIFNMTLTSEWPTFQHDPTWEPQQETHHPTGHSTPNSTLNIQQHTKHPQRTHHSTAYSSSNSNLTIQQQSHHPTAHSPSNSTLTIQQHTHHPTAHSSSNNTLTIQ